METNNKKIEVAFIMLFEMVLTNILLIISFRLCLPAQPCARRALHFQVINILPVHVSDKKF